MVVVSLSASEKIESSKHVNDVLVSLRSVMAREKCEYDRIAGVS